MIYLIEFKLMVIKISIRSGEQYGNSMRIPSKRDNIKQYQIKTIKLRDTITKLKKPNGRVQEPYR